MTCLDYGGSIPLIIGHKSFTTLILNFRGHHQMKILISLKIENRKYDYFLTDARRILFMKILYNTYVVKTNITF